MARRPEDPRVTDLQRYRKARARRQRQPPPRANSERFLGSRPYAGLILLAVLAAIAAMRFLPGLH